MEPVSIPFHLPLRKGKLSITRFPYGEDGGVKYPLILSSIGTGFWPDISIPDIHALNDHSQGIISSVQETLARETDKARLYIEFNNGSDPKWYELSWEILTVDLKKTTCSYNWLVGYLSSTEKGLRELMSVHDRNGGEVRMFSLETKGLREYPHTPVYLDSPIDRSIYFEGDARKNNIDK